MALKKKPVTGMKDVMPAEMEIRDYLIGLIKDTYKTFGFQSMGGADNIRTTIFRNIHHKTTKDRSFERSLKLVF